MTTRFSALAIALLLSPLAAEAQTAPAKAKANKHHFKGDYTFRLTPVTSFAPWYDGTSGKPDSGVATAPRQDILRVGTFTAKSTPGSGNTGTVTGHTIATTDDGLTTVVIDFTWSGTFTINDDGTGKLDVTAVTLDDTSCTPAQAVGVCATFEGPESYAFVINRHGENKTVGLIQTDNEGGGAKIFLTGEASARRRSDRD